MGINSLFNIAESAFTTQRLAMEVTSQNIANVNTQGYSKQTPILETAPTVNSGGFPMGSGVKMAGVVRSYDALLQQQIINGNSTGGKDSSLLNSLQQVEPSFNEVTNSGLGQAMEDFFNSWHDLSLNPQGAPERQAVISRTQVLVDTFHQMNASLTNVISNADTSLTGVTNDVTDKAKNIASLNLQIKTTEQIGGNANDLRDQRDYLLQELSTEMGFTSTEQSDGTVTVKLPLTSAGGGQTLVDGTSFATLYTNPNGGKNDILLTGLGNPPPAKNPATDTNVTATVGGPNDATKAPDNSLGELGGLLQIRDSIVGGNSGYLARLDEMAKELVTNVNAQHTQGYLADGVTTNVNFFTPAGTDSKSISLAAGFTPDKIAAAYPFSDPPTNLVPATLGPGNNINARLLGDMKTDGSIAFTVNGSTTTTSFDSYYSSFVSSVGIDVQAAKNASAQDDGFSQQLKTLRESNSGVSLDEELTNLMKYQRAFEAAAKTLNAASDMLDTVLAMVR